MNIGERLVKIREEYGYTRKRLADELNRPYRTITNYENGEREPGHDYIIEIAKKFGVSTDYILGLSSTPDLQTKKSPSDISEEARKIARSYDKMPPHGKGAVQRKSCPTTPSRRMIREKSSLFQKLKKIVMDLLRSTSTMSLPPQVSGTIWTRQNTGLSNILITRYQPEPTSGFVSKGTAWNLVSTMAGRFLSGPCRLSTLGKSVFSC